MEEEKHRILERDRKLIRAESLIERLINYLGKDEKLTAEKIARKLQQKRFQRSTQNALRENPDYVGTYTKGKIALQVYQTVYYDFSSPSKVTPPFARVRFSGVNERYIRYFDFFGETK